MLVYVTIHVVACGMRIASAQVARYLPPMRVCVLGLGGLGLGSHVKRPRLRLRPRPKGGNGNGNEEWGMGMGMRGRDRGSGIFEDGYMRHAACSLVAVCTYPAPRLSHTCTCAFLSAFEF